LSLTRRSGAGMNVARLTKRPCGRNTELETVAAEPRCAGRNTGIECDHHNVVCSRDVHSLPGLWNSQCEATHPVSLMPGGATLAASSNSGSGKRPGKVLNQRAEKINAQS
jgi:hypothetical protein